MGGGEGGVPVEGTGAVEEFEVEGGGGLAVDFGGGVGVRGHVFCGGRLVGWLVVVWNTWVLPWHFFLLMVGTVCTRRCCGLDICGIDMPRICSGLTLPPIRDRVSGRPIVARPRLHRSSPNPTDSPGNRKNNNTTPPLNRRH